MSQNLSEEAVDHSAFATLLLDPEGQQGESAQHLELLQDIFGHTTSVEHVFEVPLTTGKKRPTSAACSTNPVEQDRRAAAAKESSFVTDISLKTSNPTSFRTLKVSLTPIENVIPWVFTEPVHVGGTVDMEEDFEEDEVLEDYDDFDKDLDYEPDELECDTEDTEEAAELEIDTEDEEDLKSDSASANQTIAIDPKAKSACSDVPKTAKEPVQSRSKSFVFHWDKVQKHMRHIIAQSTDNYVSHLHGEVTADNELYAYQLKSAAEDLRKTAENLDEAGDALLLALQEANKPGTISEASVSHAEDDEKPDNEQDDSILWICYVCNKSYNTEKDMKACSKSHEKKIFKCTICQASFKSEKGVKDHLDGHKHGPFLCNQCGKIFKSRNRRDACISKHAGPTALFNCPECGKGYRRKSSLSDHLHLHSGERKFLCPICGAAFETSNTKRQHVHKMHKDKTP